VRFEIEAAGRLRSVVVEHVPDTGRFRVVVDDVVRAVDVQATDLGFSLIFEADGRSLDVAASPRAGGEWLVQFPRVDVPVVVDGQRVARGRGGSVAKAGEQRVTAPMPGRILRVLVQPGDEVTHRQGLVVIEAMKMEAGISASVSGVVSRWAIPKTQQVEAGDLILEVSEG